MSGYLDAQVCQFRTETELSRVPFEQLLETAASQEGEATTLVWDEKPFVLLHDVCPYQLNEVRDIREDPHSPTQGGESGMGEEGSRRWLRTDDGVG